MAEKLDVLAVVAHPDDAELTCGGTLIKMVDKGYRVGVLDLTAGESGSKGSAGIRSREAEASSAVIGLAVRENIGLPDAHLEDTQEYRLKIARVIRKYAPHALIMQNRKSRHPDHAVGHDMVRGAVFLAGLKKLEGEGESRRPFKVITCNAYIEHVEKPDFVVDTSDQFERKIKAISCYESQFSGRTDSGELFGNGLPLLELIRNQDRHYGSWIRKMYGEPFSVRETMEIDDIVTMGVKSI